MEALGEGQCACGNVQIVGFKRFAKQGVGRKSAVVYWLEKVMLINK